MKPFEGGCLCGAVRYRAIAAPVRGVICHCVMCRKHSGAPALAFVHFPAQDFTWVRGQPTRFRSSEFAERGFCSICGSTLTMHEEVLADRVQVAVGSLDEPERVRIDDHVWTEQSLPWFQIADQLPCFARSSPAVPTRAHGNEPGRPSTHRALVRVATRADIPAMHRIRLAVRENRLTSTTITEDDYVPAIEQTGRGWVAVDEAGQVRGFAIGNRETGNIWALFVEPGYEGQGLGRQLHDRMTSWLFSNGQPRLWLTTDPATRARRFYERAGWAFVQVLPTGEALYELRQLRRATQGATE